MSGQDCRQLTLFQGGSPVSRTALQESVWRLVMTVISGQKCGVSLETLTPDGSWEKTYGDCYQVKMDGFSAESFGTLPKWGIVSDGVLQALPQLEPYIDESGLRLLPTPTSSWGKHNIGISETPKHRKKNRHGQYATVYVLTNYNTTMDENLIRIYTLRDLGFDPYVMIYDKPHAPREIRLLQRWCNNRQIFRVEPDFYKYDPKWGLRS